MRDCRQHGLQNAHFIVCWGGGEALIRCRRHRGGGGDGVTLVPLAGGGVGITPCGGTMPADGDGVPPSKAAARADGARGGGGVGLSAPGGGGVGAWPADGDGVTDVAGGPVL